MFPATLNSRLFATALAVSCLAGLAAAPAQAADLEAIRRLAQERITRGNDDGNATHVLSVRPLPYAGLYELVLDEHKVLYTDEGVTFLINGHLFETRNFKDLTAERVSELSAIKFDTLPLELAIKHVKGNGKRKLVVFSDSDCPYCRKLETALNSVTDVTVYTFLFPIAQLHPNAPEHSRRIWCAPDRAKAWTDYWAHNTVPEARSCDVSAIDKIAKLGKANGINATPTLVFADGHVVPGAISTADLEENLGSVK